MKDYKLLTAGICSMAAFAFWGCEPPKEAAMVEVNQAAIESHIKTLSSDAFEGRKPFTEGEVKTVDYLKTQFEKMGLAPGNGQSYFQEVPMVAITGMPSEKMTIAGKAGNLELELKKDFVVYTERVVEEISLNESELVFCGYGIVAPEYGWNDYEGIDMKGKTAVVLVNDPGFGTTEASFFKGNEMTYYGRWTYKYEEAARQGAEGVLIIHETGPAGYPWAVVNNSWSGAKLNLENKNGNADKCAVQGWITLESAAKLFKASTANIGNFTGIAREKGFKPIAMELSVSVAIRNTLERNQSKNVIAKIEGKKQPNEYIVYTAHWDHLGVGIPYEGDSIYNGALDNATGTASLLAIAEAFTQLPQKPDRTIVFLSVTAEEQGLLGSAYYAENPVYAAEQTVANINMDGMPTYGRMKDFTITGIGHSEMDELAKKIVDKQGRYIYPDPHPEAGYFFRSDHFNFAKVGIPALYAKGSFEHREKGKEFVEEKYNEYRTVAYHKPADEFNAETWDLSGAREDAQLLFEVGLDLGNSNQWPRWYSDSEFKAARKAKK